MKQSTQAQQAKEAQLPRDNCQNVEMVHDEEDMKAIFFCLAEALRQTKAGRNIKTIMYHPEKDLAVVHFANRDRWKNKNILVDITGDSGLEAIYDVVVELMEKL